jgi:hypothetical protein
MYTPPKMRNKSTTTPHMARTTARTIAIQTIPQNCEQPHHESRPPPRPATHRPASGTPHPAKRTRQYPHGRNHLACLLTFVPLRAQKSPKKCHATRPVHCSITSLHPQIPVIRQPDIPTHYSKFYFSPLLRVRRSRLHDW